MPKLFIDNREVEVIEGATILDAAGKLGIEIPTMCFLKDYKPSTSCMVCVVKVEGVASLVPACGTVAAEGMRVESSSEPVYQARKAALELLLSDHLGDCLGPCQVICPADMNIPLMIRQIAAGKLRDAIETVKKDIALPAVLGRICPKPCERGCRRGVYDQAVSICLLKRYVADVDLQSADPYIPSCKSTRGKRVAIVGAGPAGLAGAYYLQQAGFACTVFDEHEKPGGMLQYGVPEKKLPRDVLDKEIALIEKLDVKFKNGIRIGTDLLMDDLRRDFDAVFVAVGQVKPEDVELFGLEEGGKGIKINGKTYETNVPGVFAGGDAVHKRKLTVRAVADGKEAAVSIGQYLSGSSVARPDKEFNTRIGKLQNGEIEKFLISCDKAGRIEPTEQDGAFTDQQAVQESGRCLHCDCRKADVCKLKQYAQGHEAKATRYKSQRRLFTQELQHNDIIYEAGKCIDCGLCVQTAAKAGEKLGLTFVGRGFDVRVAVPFDRSMAQALKHSAKQCVKTCPTGALAFKV
jgi:ferredoxin